MVVYSINDLENLSGIKAHTLRIWEKRYGIIEPQRTETNIRYYLDEDLKKIMNIALLNRNGYKISKIACMNEGEIQSLAAQLSDVDKSFENQLDGLTFSVLELNEEKFIKIFDANISQRGFKEAMLHVIYPLLDKLGMMWMTGSIEPVHEKFVTQLIKRKCLVEIDRLQTDHRKKEKFLLFLPKKESGELSILFLHYLIKSQGFRVINLGSELEVENVFSAAKICTPNYVLTIIDELSSLYSFSDYITMLSENLKNCTVLLTGLQVIKQKINYPENVKAFQSFESLLELLSQLTIHHKEPSSSIN